jgi:predicted nucleic acid-binding protein
MRYVGTSVFVPFFVPEPSSGAAERWFLDTSSATILLSSWTVVEFVSAIGLKVRSRLISQTKGRAVVQRFTDLVEATLSPILPTRADFDAAAHAIQDVGLGLRAGDALHAAIARSHEATAIVTLDRQMATAARSLGLAVQVPA